jgi:hypothetical protein
MLEKALFLVVALAAVGCVRVQTETRDILRVSPLRGAQIAPPSLDDEPALISAGADALTDDEITAAQSAIRARLSAVLAEAAPGREVRGARLRVERCALTAGAGRAATVHRAKCRVSLRAGDAVLAAHSATVVREGPAKAVTEERAKQIRKMTRNPLLVYDESERALTDAVALATAGILAHAADEPQPILRASALRDLKDDERVPTLAAAAVDLARYGATEDAPALIPHLEHEHALVRRAVATALAELLHQDAYPALVARLQNEEEDAVRVPLQQAIERTRALYPDLPAYPVRPAPSKSSTEGGRESAVTP